MAKKDQINAQAPAWLVTIRDDADGAGYQIDLKAHNGAGLVIINAFTWEEAEELREKAQADLENAQKGYDWFHSDPTTWEPIEPAQKPEDLPF